MNQPESLTNSLVESMIASGFIPEENFHLLPIKLPKAKGFKPKKSCPPPTSP